MVQDSGRSRVIAYHSREIGNILLLLLYYNHLEYIYEWVGAKMRRHTASRNDLLDEAGDPLGFNAGVTDPVNFS